MYKDICELSYLVKKQRLRVTSVTPDRRMQVTKYMRTEDPTIPHFYEAWHISEGIKKKLAARTMKIWM
ncbi:hypothetical protein MRX96_002932 [Rhipicephalus microplus]